MDWTSSNVAADRRWAVVVGALVMMLAGGCDDPEGAVTGVSLNRTTLSLVAGTSETLVATLSPESAVGGAVVWSSDDTAVATVSAGGEVTGVAPGTATVTVTTVDGGFTATCAVTVTDEAIAATGVSLDRDTLSLTIDGATSTATLVATVEPSNATDAGVSWASDDESVATVSASGVVTAVAAGTSTITVTTDDGGFTDTCAVTVSDEPVAVTGVSLDRETLTLTVSGAGSTLVATIEPATATDTTVTWASDDETVATVAANGLVSPVAQGTATITVTTNDGGFTDSAVVTVVDGVPTDGVTLDMETIDVTFGASPVTLLATVSPPTATNPDVSWSSDDTDVATVSAAGVVTVVGSGIATITATTDDGGFTDTATVTVSPDGVTSTGATTPLTGQAIVTWTDATDPNATGVLVSMTAAGGSSVILTPETVVAGAGQVVLPGLTFPEDYTISLTVQGGEGTMAAPVAVPVATVEVTHVLRSNHLEAGNATVMDGTNGSAPGETHDVVIARVDEAVIPVNYRWMLFPGLADPTNPMLVSLVMQSYDAGTGTWTSTGRFLRVNAAYAHVDNGQFYNWAVPGAAENNHFAQMEVDDSTPTFASEATFVMRPGTATDSVIFEWYADVSRRLIHTYFHVQAQDEATVGTRFEADTLWFLEPVGFLTPP